MQFKLLHSLVLFSIILSGCSKQATIKGIEVQGVETPVISLNGTWKFSMNPPENFWDNEVEIQNWSDILVPGECQMQGFAIKHDQPYVYKHVLAIPEDFDGKQILLNFHGVYSYARVWMNGNYIKEHYGGFTKWSCDITPFVTPGEDATLTVEIVDRTDDISYGSGYAKHQIGGILRDVELVALPVQNFKNLRFETDLDENYRDAELKVFYKLAQNSPAKVKVELWDANNKLIKEVVANGTGELIIPVKNPKKWDAEHPNLYTVVTTLIDEGVETLKIPEKIGFREVEVDGNELLVNGMPVKLRGACRHDIHPLLGRMTTAEYDKQDVLLAKEANMNFIRTSHYPPSKTFLEYCDEYGIYVEDETAVCFVGSHRTEVYRATGASQSDPAFKEWYLSQLEEMVEYHRNHPSIIIWSIGNENLFGTNFKASYNWMKKNDTTRPIIFSYPGHVPDSVEAYEILSMHYPSWQGNLNQVGIGITNFSYDEMPVLYDEWAHVACYNNPTLRYDPNVRNFWGQSLDSMWTKLFEAEGALGGAIWCMMDETFMLPRDLEGFNQWWGLLDPDVIPSTYMGPTVGYGEWGIIDTWRRKKPEFWATKKAYSPTKILAKEVSHFQPGKALLLPVHNRFDHTNFSELKIVWKYEDQSGELTNVNLEPHKKGELEIPGKEWKEGEKLNVSFFQNDTFLVDEFNIRLGTKQMQIPECKSGDIEVEEGSHLVLVKGNNFTLDINKSTGLLQNVMVNDEMIIKSGPHVNLMLPGKQIQYSTIEMDDYAINWRCIDFNFKVNDGMLTIHTKGKYNQVSAGFVVQIDQNGVITTDYSINNIPEGKYIQEMGLKFFTGNSFNKLSWDREGYFTAYPDTHIGKTQGEIDLNEKPTMNYRVYPDHPWGMDTKGFYYFGLDTTLHFTNMARSLKENIYSFALRSAGGGKVEIFSPGQQACRFDKIGDEFTLIVNDRWDYNSLLWGNYMKLQKTEKTFKGSVVMKIQ